MRGDEFTFRFNREIRVAKESSSCVYPSKPWLWDRASYKSMVKCFARPNGDACNPVDSHQGLNRDSY